MLQTGPDASAEGVLSQFPGSRREVEAAIAIRVNGVITAFPFYTAESPTQSYNPRRCE